MTGKLERVEGVRVAYPLFQTEGYGSSPISTLQLSQLRYEPVDKMFAIHLNHAWHSRMPRIANIGIQFAFHGFYRGVTYCVALWSSPIARLLPPRWIELRRMACSPEMPKNGASHFLGWMARYFKNRHSERERLISYQDTEAHHGTIYKAAGWVAAITPASANTWNGNLRHRPNMNGIETIVSRKIRWEQSISTNILTEEPQQAYSVQEGGGLRIHRAEIAESQGGCFLTLPGVSES